MSPGERSFGKSLLPVLALAAVLALASCGSSEPEPTPIPTPTPQPQGQINLPQDDASHPVSTEWWYYNGHLQAEDGSRYGFHFVFFELFNAAAQVTLLLGHAALTDHQRDTFTFDQLLGPQGPQPAQGFHAAVGDWSMNGFDRSFALAASLEDYALDLRLAAVKPPVLHGGDGLIELQATGDSFYYSYPRLQVTGTIEDHAVTRRVTGLAWMDHQWGDFQPAQVGWDWFSLQMDDETELMFFDIRDLAGESLVRLGTYVDPQGVSRLLSGDDVALRSTGAWRSPWTGAEYPSGWEMELESLALSLTLTPLLLDAEFRTLVPNIPVYWEGEVLVRSENGDAAGRGFVELVGYATP